MRSTALRLPTLALFAAVLAAPPVRADAIRILTSDPRGVTLRVTTENWSLSRPDRTGRVKVIGVPGSHALADPGHGLVPVYSTMLALPPDARPTARVLASGTALARENVRLAIAGKPGFEHPASGEDEPVMLDVSPLADGVWPGSPVHLGAPDSFRGRKLVGLEVRPFQYDEAGRRLTVTPSLDVRVDFNRPAGASLVPGGGEPDPHFDDVLRSAVLNFDQASGWRTHAAAGRAPSLFGSSVSPAFDETQPEVRVKIDSTGLYLLPYDLLAANGYPANVPIAEVSVHKHEYVENASPPYETIEIPIEVDDVNGNGVFDSGDRIWVYVRDWATRSGASRYQRWWGDGDVIYATVKPAGGLRVAQRSGSQGASGLTPLASYPYHQRWEYNYAFFMPFVATPSDTATVDPYQWTSYVLYYSRPDSIQFSVNDVDTSRAATFSTNWVGRAFGYHNLWSAIENSSGVATTTADSVVWLDKEPLTASVSLPGSALGPGGVDRFLTWGKNNPGPPDPVNNPIANVGLDYFEATYDRHFRAVHDLMAFNSDTATTLYQIHGAGFGSDSIRVYDVTTPEQPVRLTLGPGQISGGAFDLQDLPAGGQRQYVAGAVRTPLVSGFGPKIPAADHVSAVTRHGIWENSVGDYLLVVPEAFLPAVAPLVSLRSSQGLRVVVAPAEGIYDEFNGGRHSPAAIQRFVRYAYANWDARFMLLVGDGTLDPLDNFKQAGTDWVPILPTPGPVSTSDGYELVPSDNRYGCITGNCDPIYGVGDVIPEMMIGRLPVNSLTDAQNVIAKVVHYETLTGDPTWRQHDILLSDDAFSSGTVFGVGSGTSDYCYKDYETVFQGLNLKIRSIVLRDAGLAQTNIDQFNESQYLANEPADTTFSGSFVVSVCRPDINATRTRTHNSVTPQLFALLNAGTAWWNFQGHANEYVLTHENLYLNNGDSPGGDDKFLFNSDPSNVRPVLFTAFSCHPNMFARGEGGPQSAVGGCLGEDMVTLPYGGAIASWASSGYEVVPRDDSTHLNVEFARTMFAEPPHDPELWDNGARVVLGEVIQATFLRFVPTVYAYPYERGTGLTYTLLGDPATRVSTGRPQTLVYANDSLMTDGQPYRLHTPGDTLTMVADLVSTERIDSIGVFENAAGPDAPVPPAQFTLAPAFPDTVGGGVTGGRQYRVTIPTHSLAESYHYRFRAIDRDGLVSDFTAAFLLDATLRVDNVAIHDGDDISPIANLSANLVCPAPLDPQADIALSVNGVLQPFTADSASGDHSGREWILRWTHPEYAKDAYTVRMVVKGGATIVRTFNVSLATGDLKIDNLFAFPNPFDNDGTSFSFQLLGSDPADVRITVYTISGRRIYSNVVRGLAPGYHQIPWDGRDGEGDTLANGVYFYRMSATTPAGRHADQMGRLVKLRKPRHVDLSSP